MNYYAGPWDYVENLFRVFKDPRGLNKAPRGMDQSSAEPIISARPWFNKVAVVRNKALRVFSKDLQIASATKHTFLYGAFSVTPTVSKLHISGLHIPEYRSVI